MNLPNFFLADLPPEAELTPAMIEAACDALRRNREKFLLPRRTGEMVEILCEVGAAWLEPSNKFRSWALALGPEQTGFSRPVIEHGLDRFFRRFTPENFSALLERELGGPRALDHWSGGGLARGPELLIHIAAGNLPDPTLMSLTLGLLTRSAQFVKCASGAAFLPRLYAHSLYEANPKLGACLELAEWRGGNAPLETALFARANCVTATGSDETLSAIRSRLPLSTRFLGHGQRVSFGWVAREALEAEEIARTIAAAAEDVVAWNQKGCLSPQVIFVEEDGALDPDQFAERLSAELARRETDCPRGDISVEEAAAIASRRSVYETLAAHRADVKIWSSPDSTAWTVIYEQQPRFQGSGGNRFIHVKPAADLAAVFQGMDEMHGKVSTVGMASPAKRKEQALALARWGVTRICPLGQMQNPPLTWRHDGRPALGDLVVWSDME